MKGSPLIIVILLLLTACYSGRRQQYLALLDQADSLNRAYAQMPPDSLLREATDFFDRHGSADERVRAHYLLGCAYRDLGQAPEALQAWQDALDRADTLTTDSASLQRIMAVYGQMAVLYHLQNLPSEETVMWKKYIRLANAAADTLKYLKGMELLSKPYFLVGDTAGMISQLEAVQKLYMNYGMEEKANALYCSLLPFYTDWNDLEKAAEAVDRFENKAGLFDSLGNICKGRESYYYFKGKYLLKINHLDEAEQYFRRLPKYGLTPYFYKGMMGVYMKKGITDSLTYYAYLYENAVDSENRKVRTDVIYRISALYNYQKFQIAAQRNKIAARNAALCLAIAIVIILFLLWIYISYRKRKIREINVLRIKFQYAKKEYQTVIAELESQKDSDAEQMQKSLVEVETLKESLDQYEQRWNSIKRADRYAALLKSDIIGAFHNQARGSKKVQLPSDEQWEELRNIFKQYLPTVYRVMGGEDSKLSSYEMYTCMLLYLKFTNGELAILLDVTPQRISNLKSRANQKLFGDKAAISLEENIKKSLTIQV